MRNAIKGIIAAGALLVLGGCSDWLKVTNPTVIDVNALNPVTDVDVLSQSAMQDFATAYGWLNMYSSWFTGESDVSETFPTRNEFGRRAVVIQNGSLSTDVWAPLSQAVAGAYLVINTKGLPHPDSNISLQRAQLFLAYSYEFMGEMFCQGAALGGAPLTTTNMLDSAIAYFNLAIANRMAGATATSYRNAGYVGLARAELQEGNLAAAITAAAAVPGGFVFNMNYVDDLNNRTRVADRLWQFENDRGSMAVPPVWRVIGDPRLPHDSGSKFGLSPQDANYQNDRGVPYVIQRKFTAYTTPIRLASRLEADYITAEAQGTAAELAEIASRRTANGQPAYAGATDSASVLTEFERQRGLDFYLEGKRLGDLQRHPNSIVGLPPADSAYWKAGFAPNSNETCFPLPITETDNNKNFHP